MDSSLQIRQIAPEDISKAAAVIADANRIVADKLDFTPNNAPTNPAFITPEKLKQQITDDRHFFVLCTPEVVGTIAIEQSPDDQELFFIERLAVHPEEQGKGYGIALMDFAHAKICELGGKACSVAIINENTGLKAWYSYQSYKETGTRRFGHLPFTVCFMRKELA